MRAAVSTALAFSLALSGAAMAQPAGPLPAGKPAGLKQAQGDTNALVLVLGIGVVAAGIALVASQGNDNGAPPANAPTTTGTVP